MSQRRSADLLWTPTRWDLTSFERFTDEFAVEVVEEVVAAIQDAPVPKDLLSGGLTRAALHSQFRKRWISSVVDAALAGLFYGKIKEFSVVAIPRTHRGRPTNTFFLAERI